MIDTGQATPPLPPPVVGRETGRDIEIRALIWATALGVVSLVAIVATITQWWYDGSPANVVKSPIPVGSYTDLSPWLTPADGITTDSEFVFEQELPRAGVSDSAYWRASPEADTVYSIDGTPVTIRAFEQQLWDSPPMRVDVVVERTGRLASINAVTPESAP